MPPKKLLDKNNAGMVTSSQRQTVLDRLYRSRQACLGAAGELQKTIDWLQRMEPRKPNTV